MANDEYCCRICGYGVLRLCKMGEAGKRRLCFVCFFEILARELCAPVIEMGTNEQVRTA
jgi:hypothetical protein